MEATTTRIDITANERKATAESLKIARSKSTNNRPVLRSLMVKDGRAYITDSIRAVVLPWFDALPTGCYDADSLYAALKGAGSERARITVTTDLSGEVTGLSVERFDTGNFRMADDDLASMDDLGHFARGTFPVGTVYGEPANLGTIWDDAVARVEADDYVPEVVPFNGDFLASLVKCHPSYFDGLIASKATTVKPAGVQKPAVVCNGQPYALLMPMRIG